MRMGLAVLAGMASIAAAGGCGVDPEQAARAGREAYLVECQVLERLQQSLAREEAEVKEAEALQQEIDRAQRHVAAGGSYQVSGKAVTPNEIAAMRTSQGLQKLASKLATEQLRELIKQQKVRVRDAELALDAK